MIRVIIIIICVILFFTIQGCEDPPGCIHWADGGYVSCPFNNTALEPYDPSGSNYDVFVFGGVLDPEISNTSHTVIRGNLISIQVSNSDNIYIVNNNKGYNSIPLSLDDQSNMIIEWDGGDWVCHDIN